MFTALIPSLLALFLSFLLGNAALALGIGALVGALLVHSNSLAELPRYLADGFLLQAFNSPWKSGALLLTLQLGALSSLLDANGNLRRIFTALDRPNEAPNRKRSLTALSTMGLVCFYDGLANSILLGKISQSLAKKFKVSRPLLAYIVDSTSSAVACLVVFSTWTAYQLTLIKENAPVEFGSPLTLLVRAIPYNVYSWLSLAMIFIVIRKDFFIGPMKKFEAEAPEPEQVIQKSKSQSKENLSLFKALSPLALLFLSFLVFIAFNAIKQSTSTFADAFIEALSSNNVPWLLNMSAFISIMSVLLLRNSDNFPLKSAISQIKNGISSITPPLMILLCAWALSKSLNDLGLAQHLSQLFNASSLQSQWLPLMSFAVACFVSFLTGTSWGTLALLMPISLPLLGQIPDISPSLAPAIIGAIFGGAVFGDHCSPISDTTVVSAFATGSSVRDHARSQMPYALIVAFIAALLVYLPMALF